MVMERERERKELIFGAGVVIGIRGRNKQTKDESSEYEVPHDSGMVVIIYPDRSEIGQFERNFGKEPWF